MKKYFLLYGLLIAMATASYAQKKLYNLPSIDGFKTLKCDFHIHTVFSDGNVWPTYRISEAWLDGLDALAITDHIEYQPKKKYIPIDHNASYLIAEQAASEGNLLLVRATEITRDMPPGHFNALFITDASKLAVDSAWDAIAEAVKQGAFIQWNHPGWKAQEPDGIPKLYAFHKKLLQNKWLHGIEFFNDSEYYPIILDWCREYNLAVMGNSDEHAIISESYSAPDYDRRPMTLVFAKERTLESLKEAMFAGRTLVWFKNTIAGKEEFARPFFNNSVSVGKPYYQTQKDIYFDITNNSDVPYYLVNGPAGAPKNITLHANSVTRVVLSKKFQGKLVYDVSNIMIGSDKVLKIEIAMQ
jgi:hypothetical protein